MKVEVRDTDARLFWQLLLDDLARSEDETTRSVLIRVLASLEDKMQEAGFLLVKPGDK